MKRRIVWINLGLVLVIVMAGVGGYLWLFASSPEATTGRTVSVQTGAVSETVTATGTVETAGTVELSFASGGTVTKVTVEQGDTVKAGKALVAVDDTSAQQAVDSAQLSYATAVTSAQKTTMSLSTAQQAVADAKTAASLNKAGYEQALTQARTSLANAREAWSETCLDPALACPSTTAWAQLRAAEADVASARTAYEQAVQTASADETTNNLKVNQASVSLASAQAKQSGDCSTYGSSSKECTTAVDAVLSAQQQYDMTVNSRAVAAVQSQQSLVNADAHITTSNIALRKLQSSLATEAEDGLTAAEQSLASAELAQEKGLTADQKTIQGAVDSLAALQASSATVQTGSRGSTSTAQGAIDVASTGLVLAREGLQQTVLRAPVAGTIAAVDATVGQSAPTATTMVTLIPEASYQVVADFSEADAMKVAVGQTATVTLDALTAGTATGTVTAIDILPTEGASVTTYGATITLDDVPDGLKDGMTASVVVTVDEATDVLWVPSAAITTAGGQSTVTVRTDGVDTTAVVTTGLAGDTGTEILTGASEGDQLVVTTTDSTSSSTGFPMGGVPGGGIGGGGAPPAGG